jgi:hypothetical protein
MSVVIASLLSASGRLSRQGTQEATAPYGPLWEVGNSYCRSESTEIAAVRRQQLLPQWLPFSIG